MAQGTNVNKANRKTRENTSHPSAGVHAPKRRPNFSDPTRLSSGGAATKVFAQRAFSLARLDAVLASVLIYRD